MKKARILIKNQKSRKTGKLEAQCFQFIHEYKSRISYLILIYIRELIRCFTRCDVDAWRPYCFPPLHLSKFIYSLWIWQMASHFEAKIVIYKLIQHSKAPGSDWGSIIEKDFHVAISEWLENSLVVMGHLEKQCGDI